MDTAHMNADLFVHIRIVIFDAAPYLGRSGQTYGEGAVT